MEPIEEAKSEIEWIIRKIYRKFHLSKVGNFILYEIDDNEKDKNAPSYYDQLGILDKIERNGSIKIHKREFKKHLSNSMDDSKDNLLTIEILQPQLDNFYGQFKNQNLELSATSENTNSDNENIETSIEGLALWKDGTIRYKGKIVKIRKQIKELCILFIKNPNMLITYDTIKDDIIKADRRSVINFKTIAKYVSELRRSLKVHFGKNVISPSSGEGWYFKP